MSTALDERTDTTTNLHDTTSTGKPDQAHIVMVPYGEPDQTPQAYVTRARVMGLPVTALCGYTWVPHKRASNLPVCAECKAIYEFDPKGKGDRGDLPDE